MIHCQYCGEQVNPVANTHKCNNLTNAGGGNTQDIYYKETNCEKCKNCLKYDPCQEHCMTQETLTPLGELVKAIQVFRDIMAQDKCTAHCKTYQEAIHNLSELSKNISKG